MASGLLRESGRHALRLMAAGAVGTVLVGLVHAFTPPRCAQTAAIDDFCLPPASPGLAVWVTCELLGLVLVYGLARAGRRRA